MNKRNGYIMKEPPVIHLSSGVVEYLIDDKQAIERDGELFWEGWRVVTI